MDVQAIKQQSLIVRNCAYKYLVKPETRFQTIVKWTTYILVAVGSLALLFFLYPIFVLKAMIPGVDYLQQKFKHRKLLLVALIFIVNSLLPVVFLKGEIFEILAAMMFPFWLAFLICQLSQLVGASLVFFIGRYALKKRVEKKVMAHKKLKAVFDGISIVGPWKVCVVVRLSAIPFGLVNYFFSVCDQIKFGVYFVTTFIMIIPWNIIQIWIGQNYQNFAEIMNGKQKHPGQVAMAGVVLVVTLVLFVGGYYISKRALDQIEHQTQQRRDQEELEQQPLFESTIELSDARNQDPEDDLKLKSNNYDKLIRDINSSTSNNNENGKKLRIESKYDM